MSSMNISAIWIGLCYERAWKPNMLHVCEKSTMVNTIRRTKLQTKRQYMCFKYVKSEHKGRKWSVHCKWLRKLVEWHTISLSSHRRMEWCGKGLNCLGWENRLSTCLHSSLSQDSEEKWEKTGQSAQLENKRDGWSREERKESWQECASTPHSLILLFRLTAFVWNTTTSDEQEGKVFPVTIPRF